MDVKYILEVKRQNNYFFQFAWLCNHCMLFAIFLDIFFALQLLWSDDAFYPGGGRLVVWMRL